MSPIGNCGSIESLLALVALIELESESRIGSVQALIDHTNSMAGEND